MAILTWPNISGIESTCLICGATLKLKDATIVSTYVDGRPALACEVHREDKAAWVAGVMAFEQSRPTVNAVSTSQGFKHVELYIEPRRADDTANLKSDLCWHILTRSTAGKGMIITNHPIEFLSTVRKYWKKLTKQLHIERARTLHQPKISNLDLALERLHNLSFSGSLKYQGAEIIVLSTDDLSKLQSTVATAYICHPLTDIQRLAVAKTIEPGGAIVDYFQPLHGFYSYQ